MGRQKFPNWDTGSRGPEGITQLGQGDLLFPVDQSLSTDKKSWDRRETCLNPVYLAPSTTLECPGVSPVRQVETEQVLER